MAGFVAPKIGTGVSVVDKASLYQSVSALLGDMICEQPEAERVMLRGQKLKNMTLRRNTGILKFSGTGSGNAPRQTKSHSRLYGLWKDALQQRLLKQIQAKIEQDFGDEKDISSLKVRYVCKETGSLADEMPDNKGKRRLRDAAKSLSN